MLDVSSAIEELRNLNAKKVGLQLPDGLKRLTHEIVKRLEKEGFFVIVSGKPSYGSCDLDLTLLEEVDVLVHVAHPPVVDVDRVIYVDYRIDYSVSEVVKNVLDKIPDSISLVSTSTYVHKLKDIAYELEKNGKEVYLRRGGRTGIEGLVLGCNFRAIDRKAEAVLFVGDGTFHPRGAAIYTDKEVYAISPLENRIRKFGYDDVNRFLRTRFSLIGKAMECENFCVVVSSKPGQKRLELARSIYNKLKSKYFTSLIYFDDVNPENFPCSCIVNTACPRIAYDDWRRFGIVLTPQEVEILLKQRKWEDYELDEIN